MPSELFEMTTTRQTPFLRKENVPVNGFCWQMQDITNPRMEIGEHVPRGAYQILGKSGCTIHTHIVHNVCNFNTYRDTH